MLPRLQAKHSALASSLILGLVWGFWHLPKYLAPDYSGSFALNMVKFLTEAILYTWLFNNTRGSLLLTTVRARRRKYGWRLFTTGDHPLGKQYRYHDHSRYD